MAVKLEFDHANVVNPPTIVLAKKSGKTLGTIPAASIHFEDCFNSKNTITFKVNNENNGVKTRLWNQIKNFKLIWCKEWDAWFEITVDIDESNELVKNVEGHSIGESELSAIKLFNIQINTEEDIALDDYVPTVLYDGLNSKASLLDRIMEKAPHYSIKHVDSSIASIQRTFTFDNTSILDAFNEIGEEIGCIFILSQSSGSGRFPERGIYVYDLMNYCEICGYREEGISVCPECGGTNIKNGYGLDTNVFISNENIAKEITLTTDTSSVNNCFRLETGDDLMTATVASCNPNGTEYLWYITEETKSDMSDELAQKLSQYDTLYSYYRDTYQTNISNTQISNYNALVTKYSSYNSDLQEVANATGFSNLINIIYNAIDFELFLTSGLMPSVVISDTTASQQAALLTASSLSPIAVANMSGISKASVDANVLAFAKSIVRSTYRVDIKSSSFNSSNNQWTGIFTVENYSDEEDVADSSSITITINDNYERYVKQKIDKLLSKNNDDSYDVVGLFNKTLTVSGSTYSGDFANEIKKYALNPLKSFHENCQSCIDILSEEGISDATNWLNSSPNLYQQFYKDYRNKLKAIEAEMKLRQTEINTIKKISDSANKTRDSIQTALDFKGYIGTTLWKEFCSYRRETSYSNNNYVSDGLSNAELLNRAREFISVAQKELVKSATLQHSIESTLNNLLVIKEFEPILNSFKVGNWIRVRIDGQIYKLRLISYSIDFDELDELSVEFSDVVNCGNDISDLQSVLNQASSMATSYQCVERQAGKGNETTKTVKSWFSDGLNATLTRIMSDAENQNMTFDNHGLLMRRYDDVSGTYYDEQLRIINSTILITDDNWETTKTAIGRFYYIDPSTGNLKQGYGVNGETIVGKLIIGQSLALYNSGNTMKFDANGLNITNGTNTFKVNPNDTKLVSLLKGNTEIMSVDANGDLSLTGSITASGGSIGGFTIGSNKLYYGSYIELSKSKIYLSSHTDPAKNAFYAFTESGKVYIALRGNGSGSYFGYLPDTLDYTDNPVTNPGWGLFFDDSAHIESFTGHITLNAAGSVIIGSGSSTVYVSGGYDGFYPYNDDTTTLGGSSKRWKKIYASDTTISSSDRKDKNILGDIDFAEDLIMSISPKCFMWKNGDQRRKRMGFIAQDVAEVCKSINENLSLTTATYKDDDRKGYYGEDVDDNLLRWSISYEQLIAPIVAVVQSQNKEIRQLKEEIERIKNGQI